METRHISFYDKTSGLFVGELMTATNDQIDQILKKGFKVIDVKSNTEISQSTDMSSVGISECIIGC